MGVGFLPKVLKKPENCSRAGIDLSKNTQALYRGEKWGVDVSVLIHRLVKQKATKEELWGLPIISCPGLISYIHTWINRLRVLGVIPVLYFDGVSPPCKKSTFEKRNKKVDEAVEKMKAYVADPSKYSYEEVCKTGRETVKVRPDMIAAVVEWAKRQNVPIMSFFLK